MVLDVLAAAQMPFTSMEDCHVLRDAVLLLLGVVVGGGGLQLIRGPSKGGD